MRTQERVYEMLWDCSSCGTRKLLGKSHRHCAHCGAPQDPATRYFPEDHEKVAVHDHVYHGADLHCAHCDVPNSAAAQYCVNCGAPIGDDDRAVALVEDEEPAARKPRRAWRIGWTRRRIKIVAVLGVLGLIAAGVAVTLLWTHSVALEVTDHSWQREVRIERFGPMSESAWCDSMPGDAYSVSRSRKQRSTNRIPDGETCSTSRVDNGDGTYREVTECETRYREEPVYDDYCSYTVDRWQYSRSVTASGGLDDPPHWPQAGVRSCHSVGCEREGGRYETYTVHLVDEDGESRTCDVSAPQWRGMTRGSRWTAEERVLTGGLICDTLARRR